MKPWSMAVKAVILDSSGRCLLVRRSARNSNFAGCWEWPGGKVDPGEDFATALVRETKEETGLDVEIRAPAGVTAFELPRVNVVLLCMETRVRNGAIALSPEHDAWEWAPLAKLGARKLSQTVHRFMVTYAARKLHPSTDKGVPPWPPTPEK